ncbi:MAG: DUF1553 domain-containing protein [Phycisphaerales bacterium]|nr:DUF1553 domain-containing protein [Phycisphaerales bacterium]
MLTLLCLSLAAGGELADQVRPLLSQNCFECHGPDSATREGGLRLDTQEGFLSAGASGRPAVVPHDANASELMRRVSADDPLDRMPPRTSRHRLSADDIELLHAWIEAGAPWHEHWAWTAPSSPGLPSVTDADWCRDDLDRHVLAALEAAGHGPAPEADRATLLRRASFDLTGLPPSIEAMDAFEADIEPGALGRAVDRLLAQGAFGEHMAAHWLDLARYADTYGYQNDKGRHVWPWRDWVVRACNENLPHDEFLVWQLAGDLLPDATHDQKLATAFNRLHRQTNEGGSVEEEFRVEYVADRVDTFSTTMLGLTVQCARCHDHKFDPISQREYWQLSAFFDDIDECGLYSHFTAAVPTPALDLPTAQQSAQIAQLSAEVAELEAALPDLRASRRAAFETWRRTGETPSLAAPTGRYSLDDVESRSLANAVASGTPGGVADSPAAIEGVKGKAALMSGDDNLHFPDVGHATRADPITLSLWVKVPRHFERAVVIHRSKSWTDAGSQGYHLLLDEGRPIWSLVHFWPGDAISVRGIEALPLDTWTHITVSHDGSSRAEGLAITINGDPAAVEVVQDQLTRGITGGGPGHLTVGQRFRDNGFAGGGVDEVQVFDVALTPAECALLHDSGHTIGPNALFDLWLERVDDVWASARSDLHEARRKLAAARDRVPQIMTMRDSVEPKQAYLLERGRYDARGEPVDPGMPALLGMPEHAAHDRLDLARWVVDPSNPLTARVAVNRLWTQVFGRGLVETPGDFGVQGMSPSNRALLDMLAVDFIESGWDVKAMLRRLVTSATWRQQSVGDSALVQADPDNRLLGRGPARRLTAEMVRDQALTASGLLASQMGGPPVFPPQPPGLWLDKAGHAYPAGQGEQRWRRSLYTYWKRTSPPPSMMLFDASHRESCVAQREQTDTPLQALVLMNDEQFLEAARVLAQRVLQDTGGDVQQSVMQAFRLTASRRPTEAELEVLLDLHASQLAAADQNGADSTALGAIGAAPGVDFIDHRDLAAMMMVCSTILNTDAAMMRR